MGLQVRIQSTVQHETIIQVSGSLTAPISILSQVVFSSIHCFGQVYTGIKTLTADEEDEEPEVNWKSLKTSAWIGCICDEISINNPVVIR